ncbi:hypothetical protein BP5796_00099 [Coleophoma crateriformis]|uniref:Calcium channel subunit cch1 n=1 Tax=Coleophoma crateriformis TaxID=565419 RepID=A0A3D8T711_9HELO|nr:hypothetical protein BP5796_00099 [Coleophoma crateriformis]
MPHSRFNSISARFSSFRRTSVASSANSMFSTSNRDSYASNSSASPVATINQIIHHQPSMVHMEEERKIFGSGLEILEPRPIVYWGGLEERMGSL